MIKFQAGDIVIVMETASEVCYPKDHFGLNVIRSPIYMGSNISFTGHVFTCLERHIRFPTKLELALK